MHAKVPASPACPGGAVCGDGKCDAGETKSSCAKDCAAAGSSCKGRCGTFDQDSPCNCDDECTTFKDCCADYPQFCGT